MMSKIDIISSVFNCDLFLDGFFEDLFNQTYIQNCQLILVAPLPSQKLRQLFNSYIKLYNNILVLELDRDPGLHKCLNLAIQYGNSPYITIANVDDRKKRDSLEIHAKALDKNPDVDLVYSISYISRIANETFDSIIEPKPCFPCSEFNGISGLLSNNSPHNNPMWRRSMLEKHGMFNENLNFCGDWELWLRCVSNGCKFKKINQKLGVYYLNPQGISTCGKNSNAKRAEENAVRNKYSPKRQLSSKKIKNG